MAQHVVRIELFYLLLVLRKCRRQAALPPQLADTILEFALLLGESAVDRIDAGAGVRVHEPERRLLGGQVGQHLYQHEVLEYIGVVAGMEAVAVAEHLA